MSLKLQIVIAADGTAAITGLEAVGDKVGDVGKKTRQTGKDLENSMGGIGTQLERMKSYLIGFVVFDKLVEYAGKAIKLADEWTILNGKILLATGSSEKAAAVTDQLYNMAQQLRVPLAETATLYGRLVPALKEFGGGSAEAVRITNALALSLKISGATQAESASAMLQFSQAMSAGALRGEEFNSMADAAPRLLQALADGMGKTRGELKGLAEQGKLTTDVVYAALSKQLPQLEKEYGKLPMTVGDAWTKMGNAALKTIGQLNEGGGYTEALAKGINAIAEALPNVISTIQLAFIALIAKLQIGWIDIKYTAEVSWEQLKLTFANGIDSMRSKFGEFVGFVADAMRVIPGLDAQVASLNQWKQALDAPSSSVETLKNKINDLTTTRNNEVAAIDNIVSAMFDDEAMRGRVTDATRKQQQATDKLKTSHKLSAEEQQKLTNSTDKLKQSITEQEDELKRVIVGQQKVTESEKLETQVKEFLTKQGKNLTEAERQYFLGKLQLLPQLQSQADAQKKLAAEQEAYTKKLEDGLKSIQDNLDRAIEERESMGKTEAQVAALHVARDRETLAMLQNRQAIEGCSQALDHDIEVIQKRIAEGEKLVAQLEDNSAFQAQQDQLKTNAEKWTQFADDIGKDFTDGFQRMLEDGKSGWDSFTSSIKNTFMKTVVDWMYNAFAKPIVVNLIASMSGGSTPGTSGISNLIGMAKGAYNFLSGGALTSMGDGITSLGARFGSTTLQDFGAGMSGGTNPFAVSQTASSAGSIFGSALSTAGGYYIGNSINSAISGEYKINNGFNTLEKVGTAVASAVFGPIGGAVAGAVSGLVNRAFGMGDKKVQNYGITGTFSGTDFNGQNYANWKQNGGWFRSDRKGTDYSALDGGMATAMDSGFAALKTGIAGYAKSLGLATTTITGYSKQIKLELTNDQEANQKKITELFSSMGDEMAKGLLPNISTFALSGETASATLQRLATIFDVTNAAASLLGGGFEKAFGNLDLASSNARQSLIALSGGLEAFSQKVAFYYDNFYTPTEKNARAFAELDAKLDQLGVSLDLNVQSFRSLMDSDAVSNTPELQAALLDLAPLFTQVVQGLGDAAAGQKVGTGTDATGLTEKQLNDINNSAALWWKNYQPTVQAQTDQAVKTTDAIVNLTNVSSAASEAIRLAVETGNTQLAQVIASIQASQMSSEAQAQAIQSIIAQMGRQTSSAVETAVSSNARL